MDRMEHAVLASRAAMLEHPEHPNQLDQLDQLIRRVVIMGLEVVDPVGYSLYRVHLQPVLVRHGVRVEYDFVVEEVIESPCEAAINRVVALSFPSMAAEAAF